MADLIARLESGPGSRGLSDECLLAVGAKRIRDRWWWPDGTRYYGDPPDPSQNVHDAILWMVPEGWQWQTSNRAPAPHMGRGWVHNGELHMSGKYQGFENTAATPALALSAAGLKAFASIKAMESG